MKFKLNPAVSLLLCAVLWSTSGFLVKIIPWNAFAIAGARSLLGSVTLILLLRRLPVLIIRDGGGINRRLTFFRITGSIFYSLTMISFILANKMTSAANAILLQYTTPVYVIIFSPLILGEKNKIIDYLAVAGALCGMVIFVLDGLESGSLNGNLVAILSGALFAFTTMFLRCQRGHNSIDSFTLANIITFIVAIPFAGTLTKPDFLQTAGILFFGIAQIGIAGILYAYGIERITTLNAVLLTMIEPVMNPVWVFLFLGEVPGVKTFLGGAVILCSIIVRQIAKRNER